MYVSFIGKKLVEIYNEKHDKEFTCEEFFDIVMFPLFFQEGCYLMHVGNSPIHQPSFKMDDKYSSEMEARLAKLKKDVSNGVLSMSTMVSGPTLDINNLTSGQISDTGYEYESEDYYASWIGQALAIATNDAHCFLINNHELLYKIFQGWIHYKDFLVCNGNMKDKQIETWNGYWLSGIVMNKFEPVSWTDITYDLRETDKNSAMKCKNWNEILFYLSKFFDCDNEFIYCHKLGQMNKTVGWINVEFKDFRKMYKLVDSKYTKALDQRLNKKDIETYRPASSIVDVCLRGSVDINLLEPYTFRKYVTKGLSQYAGGKNFKFDKEELIKENLIIKTWIMGVLEKDELNDMAGEVAEMMIDFENDYPKKKSSVVQLIKDTLASRSLEKFIECMTEILKLHKSSAGTIEVTVSSLIMIEKDSFYLFLTLLKFNYELKKTISNE